MYLKEQLSMKFLNILIGVALALVGFVIFFFGFLGGLMSQNWVVVIISIVFGGAILVYGNRLQREG
jgi:Na+(H+)/acetate symporter ActP